MNFGSSDVNLNLASSLKAKSKRNDTSEDAEMVDGSDQASVIDLADLLKEKGSIFKWIEEEPLPSQNNTGNL